MSQQVFDIDTVGYGQLGEFFDFYVNNTFYLLAPDYYYSFYAIYLNRCLACYDGWVNGWHNRQSGLVPQRMLQSIARGLNNMLFAHGIDMATFHYESTANCINHAVPCGAAGIVGFGKQFTSAVLRTILQR